MANERIESLEQDLKPEGECEVEYWSIDVVYHQSSGDGDVRGSRQLPATYDPNVPYCDPFWHPEKKKWIAIRTRYPLEDSADPGSGGVPHLPLCGD